MTKFIHNRWSVFAKYFLTSILLIIIILALLSTWRAGLSLNAWAKTVKPHAVQDLMNVIKVFKKVIFIFSIGGLILAIFNFAVKKNPIIVISLTSLVLILIIILFTLLIICINDSTQLNLYHHILI